MGKCSGAPECNQFEGHPMPHGQRVSGGVVLAPWSDSERSRFDLPEDEPIPCNSCGASLILDPKRTRATCQCGQKIAFDERGYTQTVLPRLYPDVSGDPKMMRELADYRVEQWLFVDRLRLRFGMIDADEFAANVRSGEEARERFIEEEVLPLEQPKRPWWRFWG